MSAFIIQWTTITLIVLEFTGIRCQSTCNDAIPRVEWKADQWQQLQNMMESFQDKLTLMSENQKFQLEEMKVNLQQQQVQASQVLHKQITNITGQLEATQTLIQTNRNAQELTSSTLMLLAANTSHQRLEQQQLHKQMANISDQLEAVLQDRCLTPQQQWTQQQVRLKCGDTMVRYYDLQFVSPPLVQNRSRDQLLCELRAGCNPLLIQQNVDGSNFFNRTWWEYKVGFNGSNGNYWLGNELLHQLTMNNTYKLRVDLQSWDNNSLWYWAEYSTFSVGSEATNYTLQVGGFSGNVYSDALNYHNGMKFTTKDRDNDMWSSNCALGYGGGFWYNGCAYCLVNSARATGYFWWYQLTPSYASLRTARMWLVCR